MKIKGKFLSLLAILALDAALCICLYRGYAMAKETIFLSKEAGSDARLEVKRQLSGEKQIALTFDDGPHPVCTPRLLQGLKERGVHATFFLIGKSIDGNEEIVKQMYEEGHLIGNHGYSHVQLSKETQREACSQIDETNRKIQAVTGQTPTYIRPPYGCWNEDLECGVPMTVVLWDIDPRDWKFQNTKKVVRHVVNHAEPGSVILLHDVFPTSVDAALEIIDELTELGYTFVTVDELLVE